MRQATGLGYVEAYDGDRFPFYRQRVVANGDGEG